MTHQTPRSLLRRWFSGLTEQTFVSALGIGDPSLIDYLADLLCRFVHIDDLYRLRNAAGRRLDEVAAMLVEAEGMPPEGKTRREIYRHIGDFTLFWTGVYPEALARLRHKHTRDFFIDYCTQGKRSYLIASAYDDEPYQQEAPVLRRLSHDFELCAYGLSQVRRDWSQSQSDADRQMIFGD